MEGSTAIVIGVRFTRVGKSYNFLAQETDELKIGDQVLVETSRGYQLGTVTQFLSEEEDGGSGNVKPIIRKATPIDLIHQQEWTEKESEVIDTCKKLLSDHRIHHIKVVDAEYGYEGQSLTLLISSKSDEKVDVKPVRDIVSRAFPDTATDVRQVGPRDVAKIFGGLGACGKPERCCSQFLTSFSSISIRMAKEQEISLTPEEITGMCGRLRCCLNYEYIQYKEGRVGLPKKNKWVETPDGIGRVTVVLPLRSSVLVDIRDVGLKEFSGEQVTLTQNPGRTQPKSKHSAEDGSEKPERSRAEEETKPESSSNPDEAGKTEQNERKPRGQRRSSSRSRSKDDSKSTKGRRRSGNRNRPSSPKKKNEGGSGQVSSSEG